MPALRVAGENVIHLDLGVFRRPAAAILPVRHDVVPIAAQFQPGHAARHIVHVSEQQLDAAHFDGAIVQLPHLLQTHRRIFLGIEVGVEQGDRRRELRHVDLGAEGDALLALAGRQRIDHGVVQRILREKRQAIFTAVIIDRPAEHRLHAGQLRQLRRLIDAAAAGGEFIHLLQRHHVDVHRANRLGDGGHVADLAGGDIEAGDADLRRLLQFVGFVFQAAQRAGHFAAVGVAVGMPGVGRGPGAGREAKGQ